MNKKYTKVAMLFLLTTVSSASLSAQAVSQKLGSNPFNISSSAVLELESTTKGFLPSRMSAAQRNVISSPAKGLMIYNTDADLLEVNTGTALVPVWKAATLINPAISTKSAAYTVKDSDSTILCDAGVLAFTITFPAASTANGKVYVVSKIDDTDNVLTFSPSLRFTSTVSVSSLNYPRSFRIQSDGTNWNIIE